MGKDNFVTMPIANLVTQSSTKNPFVYINGKYVPAESAQISPLDRGFVFGDGVYEVVSVINGKLFYLEAHIQRLTQSLQGIRMKQPFELEEWRKILQELVEKNGLGDQWLYLQVTRGIEMIRNHAIPSDISPTIFAISYTKAIRTKEEIAEGLKITTVTDIRWKYCNIKTTSRLAYILMYQEAVDGGFDEAIIIHNGQALECTTSNLFVIRHGVVMTPPKSPLLLSGITRDRILALAEKHKIPYRETKITERDLLKADEIWITSSGKGILPVVKLDMNPVGQGVAGPLWNKMWDHHAEEIAEFSLSISN